LTRVGESRFTDPEEPGYRSSYSDKNRSEADSEDREGPGLLRGDLKLFLLYLLSEGARHGYQLLKDIERKTGGAYRPSPGSLYPNLQALEEAGLVKAEEDEGRKVYYLTKYGQGILRHKHRRIKEVVRRVEHAQATPAERRRSRALAAELEEDLQEFVSAVLRRVRHIGLDPQALRRIRRSLEAARAEVMATLDSLEEERLRDPSDSELS